MFSCVIYLCVPQGIKYGKIVQNGEYNKINQGYDSLISFYECIFQAIKQMYVLVLGLDVLGNPFGLIRGLSEGVEAFFYEPYQVLMSAKKHISML